MDDVPLAGKPAQLLAERGDGVDGGGRLGLLGGLVVPFVLGGLVRGVGLVVLGHLFVLGLVLVGLGVYGVLLGGLARGGVSSFDLVRGHGIRRLDDVELVLGGLDGARRGLGVVVQVRVRHDGCFFLDTNGWNMRKGRL